MSEQEIQETIERYFQAFERRDLDASAGLMHDDYIEEFPQSGERIRGKQNARSILEGFPSGLPNVVDHSYLVSEGATWARSWQRPFMVGATPFPASCSCG